jgi:hypothetical protein
MRQVSNAKRDFAGVGATASPKTISGSIRGSVAPPGLTARQAIHGLAAPRSLVLPACRIALGFYCARGIVRCALISCERAAALEQGGAYVAKIRMSFSEYRRRWESHKDEVLAWHDERLMKYPSSVAVTWLTTFEQPSESERKLLNILAWFAPEPVPLSLLGNIVDGADARDALSQG